MSWFFFWEEKHQKPVTLAHIAHIKDEFDALYKLDAADFLPGAVARNIDRIPDRQPEELNL